jgi:hypothetical protein
VLRSFERFVERFHFSQSFRGGRTLLLSRPRTQMLAELFPDDDYKFQIRFERGAPPQIWQLVL